MSSNAEQLADDYAQGEIDGVPKCGQGNRTKTEQELLANLNLEKCQEVETSADDDIKLKNDLFNLAEKLRIELEESKKENKELSANLDVAMSRADQVDELEYGLANSQKTIHVLQMSLWKSFPFPDLSYYIKTQSRSLLNGQFRYLYVEADTYYLRSSVAQNRSEFKFTKNSDDSFSICFGSMGLQTNSTSRVIFTDGIAGKFVLFFHQQQNYRAGLLVDISSMAGNFLCVDNDNNVVANTRTQPADKFLIVPVGVE